MLENITNILLQLIDLIGPLGIFIASAIESVFPPIPSEIILFTAGLYAKSSGGIPTLIIFAIAGALGNFIGTLPFYYVAKKGSQSFLPRFLDKWGYILLITNNDILRAQRFFERRGKVTIFLAKLVPGFRSLIAFPAGLSKVSFTTYAIYSIAGSILWNLVLSGLGFLAYDQKDKIFAILKPVEDLIVFLIVGIIAAYILAVIWKYLRMRAVK